MCKDSKNVEQTKKNIIEAFLHLYRIKEIDKISVKEICNKAGYTRATFYNYFIDIYDLRDYIQVQLLSTVSSLHRNYVLDPTLKQDPAILHAFFQENYRNSNDYIKILLCKERDPIFYEKYITMVKTNVLKLFVSRGLPEDDDTLKYLATLYSEFFGFAIVSWYETSMEYMPEDIMTMMHNIKFDHILNLAIKCNDKRQTDRTYDVLPVKLI